MSEKVVYEGLAAEMEDRDGLDWDAIETENGPEFAGMLIPESFKGRRIRVTVEVLE